MIARPFATPPTTDPAARVRPHDRGTEASRADALLDDLRRHIGCRRPLLVGVGNAFCGDDGVGSLLAQRLTGRMAAQVLDVSDVPENYVVPIQDAGAELVVVVDAVDFGGKPGDLALLALGDLRNPNLFSHGAGLALAFEAIDPLRRPDVVVLGIQPGSTTPGSALSPAVQSSLEALEHLLVELLAGAEPAVAGHPPSR